MEGDFRDLDAVPPWWRMGFDGKALLEAFVGTVVGLIALFFPMTTSTSPTVSSRSSSNGASGSSLSPFRSFLRMLNWRRDPAAEQRRMQLERELALLDWMHSELDLIEADLPSSSTPPPTIVANSSDC
ncbi:MAG: hypothetical protein R6W06_06795 [Prochlorococcaceae cyanobacterium]